MNLPYHLHVELSNLSHLTLPWHFYYSLTMIAEATKLLLNNYMRKSRCSTYSCSSPHNAQLLSSVGFHFFNQYLVNNFPCKSKKQIKVHFGDPLLLHVSLLHSTLGLNTHLYKNLFDGKYSGPFHTWIVKACLLKSLGSFKNLL